MCNSRFTFHVSRFTFHVFLILLVALLIRLLYWADAGGYSLAADEPDYVIPAQTLTREGRYVDTFVSHGRMWTRVPFTSLLFAASFVPLDDPGASEVQGEDAALMEKRYAALNLAQIGVSLITIPLIMLLATRAFPQRARRVALIAGWIAALYPPLASSPAQRALSEPLAVMMLCLSFAVLSFWSPQLPTRRSLLIAGAAGALFGLSALTRAVGLALLPVALLWLFIVHRFAMGTRDRDRESGVGSRVSRPNLQSPTSNLPSPTPDPRPPTPFAPAAIATVACLLVISPWTIYNYTQYRSFLLLETANATAYWHYHNFRGEDYEKRLQSLPNPADRLSLIVREGTANILEYPDRALRSAVFAFGYFWHLELNSAALMNPWDMTQRDPDVPDLLHSDALFLLVGLVGMAGLAGIGLRRPVGLGGRILLMLVLWLLAMVLLGIIVPYDGRYRLPAAPPIIIFAAGLLALTDWRAVFSPRKAWAALRAHPWTAALTALLLAWTLWGAYTPNIPPTLRSVYQAWRGDVALSGGDVETAWGRYQLAQEAFPGFYWPYRHHADQALRQGRDEEARALYARALTLNSEDPYGILGFSQLVHRHPEWDLTVDERKTLRRDEADWRGNPWNSFGPLPLDRDLEVGNGGDLPYIRGFHPPDRSPDMDYRWSRGRASIRLPIAAGRTPTKITLRMSAPAVGASEPMPVTIWLDGGQPIQLEVPVGWADYTIDTPGGGSESSSPRTLWLHIASPTRTPSLLEPGSRDDRSLGVGLDSVTLVGQP